MRKRNAPAPSLSSSCAPPVGCGRADARAPRRRARGRARRVGVRRGLAVAILVGIAATSFAAEQTITLGGADDWARVSSLDRLVFEPGRGGYLDLSLEPFRHEVSPSTALLLRFDETPPVDAAGFHTVQPATDRPPELTRTAQRTGTGALLVDGPEDRLELVPRRGSVFTPGTEWASFTLEFWFYPVALSDGDTIFAWRAREGADRDFRTQELAIEVDRGAITARFDNVFVRPDGSGVSISLRGTDRLIPRRWAHHLVRFDAQTGLLEYLVDGRPVDLVYVSRTGRQDGSVFFPRIAAHASEGLVVADGPIGALDELRLERTFVEDTHRPLLPPGGGELVSEPIDLGSPGARLTGIDAIYDSPEYSDVFFSYRLSDLRDARPGGSDWIPVRPGEPIRDARGRFLRVRAELLPDTRSGAQPRLSRIDITYEPDPPPLPPTALRAIPLDGAVTLEWAPVQDPDIGGYLVYYGDRSGRYFGAGSEQGASPVDAGAATSVTLSGLENGTLYFFAVRAYSSASEGARDARLNELSTEVAARPAKVYR